jgi:DNA replication protein DnaC
MQSQQMLEEKLSDTLRRLELLQIERRLDSLIEEEDFSSKNFKEQLSLILNEELAFRQERAIRMRLKLAKFPVVKSIDSFDFSFQPDIDKESILSLYSLKFIEEKANIILIGPSGVGKTHLAIALGVAACQGGYTCYFITFQNLIENLRKAEEQNRLRRKLITYNKPHVLIIDELGYLPLNRNDANLFFQLVSTRYENGSIVLTSNKSYIDWGNLFPDEGIASAILDRLLHYSKTVKIQGQSFRLAMKKKMGLFEKEK